MNDEVNRLSTRDIADAASDRREQRDELASRDPRTYGDARTTRGTVDRQMEAPAEGLQSPPLFDHDESAGFRSRWEAIQTGFVDEPRAAVREADALVAQVIARLAEGFSHERTTLEQQWDRGDDISTEDLRVSLKRYRSFFDRLLSL